MNSSLNEVKELVALAASMFARGYSFGTAGNISVLVGDVVYATPTGSSFGTLTVESMAACNLEGKPLGSNLPTKEMPVHVACYRTRPDVRAVVHLHSTHATAVACMQGLNEWNALPPVTAYYAMRVPHLPVVPYLPPGDPRLGDEVARLAVSTPAMLMRNHGSLAMGKTLQEAAALAEEIEETARLFLLLGDRLNPLSDDQVAVLRQRFA